MQPFLWYLPHLKNITSQCGEDGLLEEALRLLKIERGWCVEFGAWDGKHLSNTYNLIHGRGFSAVLIEGSKKRFAALQAFAQEHKGEGQSIHPVCAMVDCTGPNTLDGILRRQPIPHDFDVLSIDIDGNDYHVWDSLEAYRPKLVVVEFNPTIPNSVDFVQAKDMRVRQGSSLKALTRLARERRYELIAVTELNAIFVDAKYFPLFGMEDNSIDTLHTDDQHVTYIFCGYDGTVYVRGSGRLPWHDVGYKSRRLQMIPRWFRAYPLDYSWLKLGFFRLWRYERLIPALRRLASHGAPKESNA